MTPLERALTQGDRRAIAQAAAQGEDILADWYQHAPDCDNYAAPQCDCSDMYCVRTLRWVVVVYWDGVTESAMVC